MFAKADHGEGAQVLPGVCLKTTVHGARTLMTEVRLDKGAVIPPHKHAHEQTGFLVSGRVDFLVAGNLFRATPGDSWNIPGETEHSATALEASVVVEVFSPLREDYLAHFTPGESTRGLANGPED